MLGGRALAKQTTMVTCSKLPSCRRGGYYQCKMDQDEVRKPANFTVHLSKPQVEANLVEICVHPAPEDRTRWS
jgi:hypothetical protein